MSYLFQSGKNLGWEEARLSVLPTLVDENKLPEVGMHTFHESWINGLAIAYVMEQSPGKGRYVTHDDLGAWDVDSEMLHAEALRNLRAHGGEQVLEGHRAPGYTLLLLANTDPFNAARLLLPELYAKLREHLGTTFYAAIPTRQFLLAFSTSNDQILEKVRLQVRSDFSQARDGLSPKMFLVTPDGVAGDPIEAETL